MNFQVVSVGQKLVEKTVGTGGYLDNVGTPSPHLLGEIQFVDASIGKMVAELKNRGAYESIYESAVSVNPDFDPKSATFGADPLFRDTLPIAGRRIGPRWRANRAPIRTGMERERQTPLLRSEMQNAFRRKR
jgi:hypothetical protein